MTKELTDFNSINLDKLINLAFEAKKSAYAPYSHFNVGAALVADDGRVYTGCNIENSSYGATICAERTAIVKAISHGARRIKSIAIVSDSESYTIPCAICLQVMSEFCDDDMTLYLTNKRGEYKTCKFKDMLPYAFKLHTK